MGFVRIFWNNNVQEAYLPKISIEAIFSEILAQLLSDNSKFLDVVLSEYPTNPIISEI